MAGLADALAKAVAGIDGATKTLQVPVVTHKSFLGFDVAKQPQLSAGVARSCFVERTTIRVKDDADPALQRAPAVRLLFTIDVTIDDRDVFVLSDGTTGPTLRVDRGVVNPVTGRGYVTVVLIGEGA